MQYLQGDKSCARAQRKARHGFNGPLDSSRRKVAPNFQSSKTDRIETLNREFNACNLSRGDIANVRRFGNHCGDELRESRERDLLQIIGKSNSSRPARVFLERSKFLRSLFSVSSFRITQFLPLLLSSGVTCACMRVHYRIVRDRARARAETNAS